ncbi:hypothetical protein [Variovorax soli]|uniref:Uncharacterized protein n=1 Tax=Variovorax soli TaxID=376815 RepID=A0ABU1NPC4_9BURK|nr:hypothetical protein [Variovorax soli]MDR6539701.1 hypothetical protein [Variovorax soli]
MAAWEGKQGLHRGFSFNGLRWLPVEGMIAVPELPAAPTFNIDRLEHPPDLIAGFPAALRLGLSGDEIQLTDALRLQAQEATHPDDLVRSAVSGCTPAGS